MKILIARHAEDKGPEFKDEKRILNSRGVEQAKQLADIITEFDPTHIYSSSLTRSKQTAQIISNVCRISFTENDLFDEQKSENDLFDEQKSENNTKENSSRGGYIVFGGAFEGGETYKELYQRVKNAFGWLKSNHNNSSEDRIVLVTHGRFMTFIISIMLGFKPDGFNLAIENCSYIIVKISNNWRPQLILPTSGRKYI